MTSSMVDPPPLNFFCPPHSDKKTLYASCLMTYNLVPSILSSNKTFAIEVKKLLRRSFHGFCFSLILLDFIIPNMFKIVHSKRLKNRNLRIPCIKVVFFLSNQHSVFFHHFSNNTLYFRICQNISQLRGEDDIDMIDVTDFSL